MGGGVNAYNGSDIRYPAISGEGITMLNPEIIIEMIPDIHERGLDAKTIARQWDSLTWVDAVKDKHVYVFGQDYVSTPGPRFIQIVEQMARAIHQEADWD